MCVCVCVCAHVLLVLWEHSLSEDLLCSGRVRAAASRRSRWASLLPKASRAT